ncbi:MAG: TIGR02757 family protein [Cyclobacteriaceae bacterium]
MKSQDLKAYLDEKVDQYNRPNFIDHDPISIPHRFSKLQDIEIAGFLAAVLAWGQRVTIINKCTEFFEYMDNDPYSFILNHSDSDLVPFLQFKHRTFNATDALYFIAFFKHHYSNHTSLQSAFTKDAKENAEDVETHLNGFFNYFFSLEDHPIRTYKHIARPVRKSACKRLNMFLRWMVRNDDSRVDFGLWKDISPSQLVCPCDIHVDRVGRSLGLIKRKKTDWQTAIELTNRLKKFDPKDPVKYDFALFGLGVEGEYY